jgi:hypothetical protein
VDLFLERMEKAPTIRYSIIHVNRLPYSLRDKLVKFQFRQGTKNCPVNYIFTELTGLEAFSWLDMENFADIGYLTMIKYLLTKTIKVVIN